MLNDFRDIIRDNMLINMSGVDDQWMGVDMNIEHLINFLKVTIFVVPEQHTYPLNHRQCSLQKGFTRLGIVLAIFRLQAISYVLQKNTLATS